MIAYGTHSIYLSYISADYTVKKMQFQWIVYVIEIYVTSKEVKNTVSLFFYLDVNIF